MMNIEDKLHNVEGERDQLKSKLLYYEHQLIEKQDEISKLLDTHNASVNEAGECISLLLNEKVRISIGLFLTCDTIPLFSLV